MKKNFKKLSIMGAFVVLMIVLGSAAWMYHETPQFCVSCHIMQPYLDSWTGVRVGESGGEPLLAAAHASADVECLNCHDNSIDESFSELVTYVKGDYRDPLKQREFSQEWCFRCHDHTSRDEIIARTEDYVFDYEIEEQYIEKLAEQGITNLEDGIQINPHNFPVDTENMDDPHGDPTKLPECYECHNMHQESPGLEYCFTCHHSRVLASCTTCHEDETDTVSIE